MRRRLIIALILFVIPAVGVVIVLYFLSTQGFEPSDITTLIVSISALGISFANLFYNFWKEADLEFRKEPFFVCRKGGGVDVSGRQIPDKWICFLTVENKGRGKAEKCVGHLILKDENDKELLPPSNRSVWRLGPDDYVSDQDIGFQDDLLLFEVWKKEAWEKLGSHWVAFPMALSGQRRGQSGGKRFESVNLDYEEAKNYKLFIRLEAKTGHMPKQKEVPIGTTIEKTIGPNK